MPRLSPQTQLDRRARILDAAERCFARAGFHRTTMQDICRDAGISAGALYVYFRSKEELIEGLSQRDREEVLAEFAEAARQSDVVAALTRLLECCVVSRPREKTLLLMEIGAEATRNPRVAATLRACDDDIRARLEAMLAEAVARGQIAPAMPVADLARLMGLVANGMFWAQATDPGHDGAALSPHVVEMLAAAMRPVAPPALSLAPSPAHPREDAREPAPI